MWKKGGGRGALVFSKPSTDNLKLQNINIHTDLLLLFKRLTVTYSNCLQLDERQSCYSSVSEAGKKCDFKQAVQLERTTLQSIINAGCPIRKSHTKMGNHQ
jgi:hypothetical protein